MTNWRERLRENLNELKWRLQAPVLASTEKEQITVLREKIRQLPPIDLKLATSRAEEMWWRNRIVLRQNILRRDPRNFLNWGVIKRTMFNEPAADKLATVQSSTLWPEWQKIITEDKVGNPPAYVNYPTSSGNLVNHLASLNNFSLNGGPLSQWGTVFEFGGGYGSLARLIKKAGSAAPYIIFDLPEFSYLQAYFLTVVFPVAKISTTPTKEADFILLSSIEDLTEQFKLTPPNTFIALWSLSESPLEVREQVLKIIGQPLYWFIGYQAKFKSIDNIEYFNKLAIDQSRYEWKTDLVPNMGANYYLVGKEK
jgi:hypothetical protein